jgi:LPXTG-site transpeptidase (sortase) family protein
MRILSLVGKVLIGAGIVLLLFVAYLVWGTALQQSHTQNVLRTTLEHKAQSTRVRQALAQPATGTDKLPTGPPKVAPTTASPPEGTPVGEIRIPAIGIDQVIVSGTETQDLRQGPGHYTNTPLPGQAGNAGVAGHRTTYGHPFYNLNVLKVGDPIVLTTVQGVFVYDTTGSQVVSPSDGGILQNQSGAWVTLTTCNPRFSASTRLVVTAKLVHSELFADAPAPTKPTKPARSEGKSHHAKNTTQSGDLAGNSNGQLLDAILWGLGVVIFGAAVLLVAHRYRQNRGRRWAIHGGGIVVSLVLLYCFFTAISPLLPASL